MTMRVVRIVAVIAVSTIVLLAVAPVSSTVDADADGWSVVYRYPRESSALSGIDALTSRDVWAVGGQGGVESKVVQVHWDGARWHQAPSWQPRRGFAELHDVQAIQPDVAWSVGRLRNGALVLRWNGIRWERVRLPHAVAASAELRGIDGVGDLRALWAVGRSHREALILRWNGSAWRRMNTPDLPNSVLYDVVSASRTTALAVGQADGSSLIMRWHRGDGWRVVPAPVFGDAYLMGIAASQGRVVAAGYGAGPLLLERTEAGWREVPWEWAGADSFLNDVAARAGTFWVVGPQYRAGGEIRPFVLRGRNGHWRDLRVPAPGLFSGLDAVTVSATWVWATGHEGEGEGVTGFVMRGGAPQ